MTKQNPAEIITVDNITWDKLKKKYGHKSRFNEFETREEAEKIIQELKNND